MSKMLLEMKLPKELEKVIDNCKKVIMPESREELINLALGGENKDYYEVAYDVEGQGSVLEATVARCKNGAVINYTDIYLRRRDPDSMVIGDEGKTDKQRFKDKYGYAFDQLRNETFLWLENQELILLPFLAGGDELGYPMLLVAPANAGFFAAGLADLQGFVPASRLNKDFKPRGIIYLAPTFRHTHFQGKQMVVHNRLDETYELFSYNLYPGPSAKKGVYGVLLHIGEKEGWTTLHGSTVKIKTAQNEARTLMHEGASGGGKSEMTELLHPNRDGSVKIATHGVTGDSVVIQLKETCEIQPITDDMALCHPDLQKGQGKLVVKDAEHGWFLRTDHINSYGTAPSLESLCLHPKEPLIFLNYDAVPGSTCLIWDHTMDTPNKPCPNPRVIMPRKYIENTYDLPAVVDIRSFGMRAPLCTRENPSYGIIGMAHVLTKELAWIWRLVAPRGDNNPSITSETKGLSSEGVGSYWPFATGTRVAQANLLLEQIVNTPKTSYLLIPNQHIGAYKVGFNPQWIMREYMTRQEGAIFETDQLEKALCPLLGYQVKNLEVDGNSIPNYLLDVSLQSEVGVAGYEKGSQLLMTFFKKELAIYLTDELNPLGREIIERFIKDESIEALIHG